MSDESDGIRRDDEDEEASVTSALGFVVALAWNTALSTALAALSGKAAEIIWLFIYALIITLIAVMAIIFLGRVATRIGAEPIQFGLPPAKKDEEEED